MALDLFKRVETRKGLFAVEKITLIYNLLTSILILFLFQEMDHPVQMLADRVVIAGMTFLLMYLYRLAPCKFSAFVRIAIQMSLLSYWYPDTFEFNRIFPNLDHVFASVEQWMFGGQPAVWFCERFPQMWVSEPFNMGYFFYYPMILLVVVWYFLYRFDLFEKVSFVIVTAFFIYYLIYFFYNLVESSQQVGERPTAAFPSSHVGMSTVLMIMAWRGSKRLFACLFPFYLLLCGATVYIQAHYLIDSIVGFVSAFGIYILATWMFKRWFAQPMFR